LAFSFVSAFVSFCSLQAFFFLPGLLSKAMRTGEREKKLGAIPRGEKNGQSIL
jgi:hypothetical protein